LRLPEGFGIRNDCGVYEGAEIPIHYDPMIAKLIVWGEDRAEAIRRLKRALREYQVRGVKTNIPFHQWMLRHPQFIEADFYTGFVDEQRGFMAMEQVYPDRHVALASAAIVALHREQERALRMVEKGAAEKSEWREAGRREALQVPSGASSPRRAW
jgi:acetyl-CoA carboxylase biotin carboxylase subunit